MKTYITDPNALGGIHGEALPSPTKEPDYLLEVSYFSLNRGELNSALTGAPARPNGWDVAGTVLESPPGGPPPGTGRIEGFNLFRQSEIESIARGLGRLLKLIASGQLKVAMDQEVSWAQAPQLARDLLDRKFSGKAMVGVKE